jgi:hypothetical protein
MSKSKIQMLRLATSVWVSTLTTDFLVLDLELWSFEFVSDFGFRIYRLWLGAE